MVVKEKYITKKQLTVMPYMHSIVVFADRNGIYTLIIILML